MSNNTATQHLLDDNYVHFDKHLTFVIYIFGPLDGGWYVVSYWYSSFSD
jgi:hypothetical protein